MKTNVFKTLIKEAVREVIQEELKEILLEAVRAPKQQIVTEHSIPPVNISSKPTENVMEMRQKYMDVLNGMAMTSQDVKPKFNPSSIADPINGSLPEGELGMDQIMSLLNTK
jgi:hypothetical protein